MRHVYVNRATYILAALLVLAVVAFGWIRSQGIVITTLADIRAEAVEDEWEWQELGRDIYSERCSGCHAQLTHIPELFLAEDGRSYLIDFMLFGYDGEIVIKGDRQDLTHPPFDGLSDEEIAAVLNHMLVSWDNAENLPEEVSFYEVEEIEEARERSLSRQEVAQLRPLP